jgi:hypothetical protein
MGNLLKLIAKLFGKNAMAKTIGTRTNVIKLPNNEIKRYIKKDLNIEAASDEAVMNAKKEMEELLPDLPKMNDMERLVFEGNLRRLDNRINPPMAEVVEFGTKEKVTPEGITSLIKEKGQKAPPGTVMGNLESRVKQLEASGKSLEEATEGKGKTLDDILGDVMQSQKTMSKLQDEGLVRAAVRYKMMDDLQKGVLKVPKNLEEVIRGASNEEDVINVFRKNYGEDALEQVDSLVPDFYKMTSPKEAVKKIETDFPNIQPKKIEFPETIDIDKLPPEEFATGGRVGYMGGGSTGLDYLMGIDRTNYQSGGMTLQQLQAKAPPGEFLAYINPKEAGVLKALGGSGKKINGIPSFFASSPGDTGGAGGADGAGGNDEGGGGSGDTGDMGSEAANAAATAAGAASVGAGGGIGGYGDPGVTVGSVMGNFGRNVANMARANPISSMVASAVLGPIGSLALNAARAYGPTGTTGTTSTTESDRDGTSNTLVQQAIADPLGLNAAARDMSGVDALYNQYRTNVGFQSGGRVNFNEGTLDPAKQKQVKQMIKMGADVDTISTITGATPEQIQQIQQTPRTKNADGGLSYLQGL